MNTRMQVTLTAEQHRRAKARAAEAGVSLAEYIRRVINADLGDTPPPADVSSVFDLFRTQDADIARHKDAYIDQALRLESDPGRA